MVGFPDGTNIIHKKLQNSRGKADNLGVELAKAMIDSGALDILRKRLSSLAF